MPHDALARLDQDFDAILVRGDRDEREPLGEADPIDAYEPGTVLDPEDEEVVDLVREIEKWERRGRP